MDGETNPMGGLGGDLREDGLKGGKVLKKSIC